MELFHSITQEIMLKVHLPDGSVKEYSRRVRPLDIAADIGPGWPRRRWPPRWMGDLLGADQPLPEDGEISLRLITKKDPEALDIMRHSCAHVMARAVMRLFPGSAIGLRSDHRQRLLLRFPVGAQAFGGRFSEDRGRDGRRSSRKTSRSSASRWSTTKPSSCSRNSAKRSRSSISKTA